jgi:DNA replication and repair protein RecF
MPYVNTLKIYQFRNFIEREWHFSPELNVIIGNNGAGKTSILEALYFLAHGRSFRVKELNRMIHQGTASFTLFAEVMDQNIFSLAMQRSQNGDNKNRLNHAELKSASQFAERLPVILFNPESFQLLTGGPKSRRQIIDWGVFYHYPLLRIHYLKIRRALKQRNAGLKQNLPRSHIKLWEQAIIESVHEINKARNEYIALLFNHTITLLNNFINEHQLEFNFEPGWPQDEDLAVLWEKSFLHDLRLGTTQYGPHQADLKITSYKKPARDLLSRGQQKLLITMLKLAQGKLLHDSLKITPIYLLDDLASELDEQHQKFLWDYLATQEAQILLTSIYPKTYLPQKKLHVIDLNE